MPNSTSTIDFLNHIKQQLESGQIYFDRYTIRRLINIIEGVDHHSPTIQNVYTALIGTAADPAAPDSDHTLIVAICANCESVRPILDNKHVAQCPGCGDEQYDLPVSHSWPWTREV